MKRTDRKPKLQLATETVLRMTTGGTIFRITTEPPIIISVQPTCTYKPDPY